MIARLARYTFSGNATELAQKAEEGILPTFRSLLGFPLKSLLQRYESAQQTGASTIQTPFC